MNLKSRVAPAAALLALAVAPAAHAQTFFGTTVTVTTAVTHDAAIGFSGKDANGNYTGPANNTVTLATGSSVDYFLNAYNASSLIMNAGNITGDVYAFDSSSLTFRGGTVSGNIFAYTNGTLDFDGNLTPSSVTSIVPGFRAVNVSGTLADGITTINKTVYLHNSSTARFNINGGSTIFGSPSITPVPEPGSVALLLGLGVTGAGFAAKRRKRA